jgi:RNA polymerase sigma factor (sigma-70 family)
MTRRPSCRSRWKVLTPEENKKLAEWKLLHHKVLLGRGRHYSGWSTQDVEEVVQHTWFKAVECFDRLTDQNVLPYLTRVLLNHIRDIANGRKGQIAVDGTTLEVPSPDAEPEEWIHVSDEQWLKAIHQLPRRVREAYVLRRQGLKHREIAERMGITVGGAGGLLHEAQERLRKELRRAGV